MALGFVPKKILLVNLGGLADVLFSIPAINSIHKRYPNTTIHLLTSQNAIDAARQITSLDKIEVINTKKLNIQAIQTIIKLRKEKFSLLVNMRSITNHLSALKIWLLLKIIAPQKSIGWNTAGMGKFFDIKILEPLVADKHEIQYHLDTSAVLDAPTENISIDIRIDDQISAQILNDYKIDKSDYVIMIHPGGMPSRRWPKDNFIQLINHLHNKLKTKIILTGLAHEIPLLKEIETRSVPKITNACGKLSFLQLCAIIQRANLVISNDTGPMHIAAILNKPLIAIFGPGQLCRYDPRVISNKATVFYKPTKCAPCNNYACNDLCCLKAITTQEVCDAAIRAVETNR
jgi:ADP-heptose:LPS heptosyltransferase